MTLRSLLRLTASALISLTLAACGGGGGSSDPATYAIGGTVSGLASGQQLTIKNNGTDAKSIAADGAYAFATAVPANGSYAVTVAAQPAGQTCTVSNGTGAGVTAAVANVNITCSAITYTIGGTVTGLATGEQVALNNNGADALTLSTGGAFTFATPVAYNGGYAVTVVAQPVGKTCTVSNASGSGVVANVGNADVTCSAITHTVGGTVSGLATGQQVTLNNNGADPKTVTADGAFMFTTPVTYNGSYSVAVGTQPTGQTCTVSNSTGSGVVANVSNVTVTCSSNTYTIGATVSGLATGQQVTLRNNGADPKTVTANGAFTFTTPVTSNGSYAVTVGTQPTGQTCTVASGSGSGVVANITSVVVNCSSNTYTVGGTLTGLTSGQQVTLRNNGADPKTVTANGAFTFATPVTSNGSYAVTVGTQPTGQTCTVSNGTGSGVAANVSNVTVTCSANTYTVGGTVTGLTTGQQVTLNNNGADPRTVTANAAFTFTTPVTNNTSYAVTVGTQPTSEFCRITNSSGTGGTANVTNVTVACQAEAAYVVNYVDGTVAPYTVGIDGSLTVGTTAPTGANPRGVTSDPTGRYVYVITAGDGATVASTISHYTLATDGSLPAAATSTVTTGLATTQAWSLTINAAGTYAYAVNRDSGGSVISQYSIGAAGGVLTRMADVPVFGRPHYIAINAAGTFAYVDNYDNGTVTQYSISGGALTFVATFPTGALPFGVAIDPSGSYLYVTNYTDDNCLTVAGSVSQFKIETNGALTALTSPTVAAGVCPWPVTIDPSGKYAYVANRADSTISQYTIGAGGALTFTGTAATATNPQGLAIDRTGRYAYVTANGSDKISQFIIGAGGMLTPMTTPTVDTGVNPYAITTR